jgi:uncharacterized protein
VPGTFHIEGMAVPAGATVRGAIDVFERADGTKVCLPFAVINGASPGPRLYLGAGLHGDEAGGVRIIAECLSRLDPKQLSGSVICVPVQNPPAFESDHRIALGWYLQSPLDHVPNDPWISFPGDPAGNGTEILAAALFRLVTACEYAIDVHTPTRGGRYLPITFLPPPSVGSGYERAEALGRAFGSGCLVKTGKGMYVRDGVLTVEATKAGVASIMFETGEGGRVEADVTAGGIRCLMNALRFLGMMAGRVEPPARSIVIRDLVGIRAKRGGLLSTEVALGARVTEGTVLARIWNIYGDEIESIAAPADGLFIRATTLSTVATGDRVATIGVE